MTPESLSPVEQGTALSVQEGVSRFLSSDGFLLDLSEKSQAFYKGDLSGFLKSLGQAATPLSQITETEITDHLRGVGKPSTAARKRAALGMFFTWLKNTGLIAHNPMDEVPKIKAPEKITPFQYLTKDEEERLIETARKRSARDAALIVITLQTGVSTSDLLSLKRDNVYVDHESLVLRLNGGRNFRLDPEVSEIVRGHVLESPGTGPLFTSERWSSRKGELTREGFWLNLRRYGKEIGRPLNHRTLRHTFVMNHFTSEDARELKGKLGIDESSARQLLRRRMLTRSLLSQRLNAQNQPL